MWQKYYLHGGKGGSVVTIAVEAVQCVEQPAGVFALPVDEHGKLEWMAHRGAELDVGHEDAQERDFAAIERETDVAAWGEEGFDEPADGG